MAQKKYASLTTLTNLVDKIKELFATKTDLNTELAKKADSSHTHSISNVTNLQSTLDGKVPASRTINSKPLSANITLSASDVGAASSTHNHDDRYYTETEIDSKLNGKSDKTHNHDSVYAAKDHNHSGVYAVEGHNHDDDYAAKSHNHDDRYYTESEVDTKLSGKANSSHTHSIANITNLQTTLDGKSNTSHSHSTHTQANMSNTDLNTIKTAGWYYGYTGMTNAPAQSIAVMEVLVYSPDWIVQRFTVVNGAEYIRHWHSATTWSEWKTEIDSGNIGSQSVASATKATQDGNGKVIASTYETKSDASAKLTEAKTYADNAANTIKNDLLNNAGAAYDTLKELGDLIDDNKDAIDALETVAAGKANATHIHAISDVTNLQSTLDGKAAKSHGTHVSYSTTAPVMDGTASVGSASTVARSDHKHPTDTSRASKTEFDSHTADTTAHMTSTQKTQLSTAYNHSQAVHAPSDAQKNQNAFSNIAVSGQTTVAADTATDTVTFAGSNVSITTDATNDKVTFSVADATTSTKGVVQLSDSVTSDSSTTAATSYSVRAAHKLAGQAYDLANSKADHTHNHTVSQIGDLTVSASELNYMDGVTSNVQAQLDGKQSSITGGASTIASSNLTANRALVSNANGKVGVSLVTATELGYLDGVTSNIQTQLNDKAAYSHNHSAAHITSGIMDAARLPDASETQEGVVTTQTQSFAGNKTFTGTVTAAGMTSNGNINAGAANTYDIGSSLKPFKKIYTQDLYVDAKVVAGSVLDGGSFVKETDGTTTTKGITRLTVGNYIAKGKNGNAEGRITIYNENNGSATLRTSHTDSDTPTIFLPDHMGTLVTEDDIAGLASVATVTQAEYSALEEAEATNANTLYMITDAEEEVIPQIQFITWEEND